MADHGTADICDLYHDQVGVFPAVFKSFGGKKRCAGEIVTIKLKADHLALKALLQSAGNGRIIVADVGGSYCAVLGDKLTSIAIDQGWAGIVINGYIRDSDYISKMPLAIWALGTCPRRSHKPSEGQRDAPLEIGEAKLNSGDYLYGDEDGIIISSQPFAAISFAM